MHLTAVERETVITFNDGESWAEIYTSQPTMMTKFDRLCDEDPAEWKHVGEKIDNSEGMAKVISKTYKVTKKSLIRFGKTREMSEAQKETLRKNLSKAQNAQRSGQIGN